MQASSTAPPAALAGELGRRSSLNTAHPRDHDFVPVLESRSHKTDWRAVISFFFLGLLVALPSTVVTTAANVMFTGYTGVYEVCASLTGATASFGSPFIAHRIPYGVGTAVCTAASLLTYLLCTLPHPLDGPNPAEGKAGPVIGVMLGGFVYAYGTNLYMAAAAFFPSEAVLGLSAGSGCAVILGPGLYTTLMIGLAQDWRRTLLILLPTALGIPAAWWGMTSSSCRAAAESSRRESSVRKARQESGSEGETPGDTLTEGRAKGFGKHGSRAGLLFKTMVPKYVLPLILCTSSSMITLLGSAPTLQAFGRFRNAPEGNLQFQLAFLSYGVAQFTFSVLSGLRPIPLVWIWTGTQLTVMAVGLAQLAYPFLTYYGVWIVMLFLTGACVGGGVTNTNYKISEDFRRAGEEDEVRSFAMSFAGLGNFGGDALGGAFAVLVQQVATKALSSRQ